ncbi:MAG: hypothetical protein E7521_01435 [Ruminococcaceae bacterium]|nr:hypothetical protein [Oscillospiraceae bacterium]
MEICNKNVSVCFWSWNSEITREGIDKQLKDFADGRIGGVVIHARGGLKIQYMGEEWFELFKYAAARASELGLEVWIYDEEGWPSGFGGGAVTALGEDYWHKCLQYSVFKDLSLSDLSSHQIVAVYNKKGEGEYERSELAITDSTSPDSIVFWYEADSHYVDLMNPNVTVEFIKSTHEKYYAKMGEYFGTVIKGFFTDEPQMNNSGYPWSISLCDAYRCKENCELLDKLWLLAFDTSEAEQFKLSFWNIVSDLYYKNFVWQLSEWCSKHGVKLTGHFAAEDGLCQQTASCGDLMRNYSAMQLPAIDHLGSRVASPVLMKQASSVSRQYCDGNVLSETFGCAGWGVTFKRLEWIWGGQSVLGITKPCYHLSAYSIEGRRKRDYPAFYSYQEPWWNEFKGFANWMQRLNSLMTQGERELHTLVIPPQSSIKSSYQDEQHNQTEIKRIASEFRELSENLLDMQLDFDYGDEFLLCRDSVVENGNLRLGNVKYDTVILSETIEIDKKLCTLLCDFVKSGGRLIAVNRLPRNWCGETPAIIVNRRNTFEKYVEYYGIKRTISAVRTDNLKPVSNLRLHTRHIENGYRVHIWTDDTFLSQNIFLRFDKKATVYEVNLYDGSRQKLAVKYFDDGILVPITIDAFTNTVIELDMTNEQYIMPQKRMVSKCAVEPTDIYLCEKNSLTIDYAELSLDGGKTFAPSEPVIRLLDKIYEKTDGRELDFAVRYSFYCKCLSVAKTLNVAVEDIECKKIEVNGISVSDRRLDWWIDNCIGLYDISEHVNEGLNTVTVHYSVKPKKNSDGLLEMFETERNRFCYPVEPESIYILGDFDVVTDGDITDRGYCYSVGGGFTLVPPTKKCLGDLTKQNMWFYRGNACYKIPAPEKIDGRRTIICVDNYHGTLVAFECGGKKLYSSKCPAKFDVTDIPFADNEEITITLIGSNRNLFGPHHHVNGESYLIGPATFEGRWDALTGFMVPELYGKNIWDDNYGVIPFGIEEITVEIIQAE